MKKLFLVLLVAGMTLAMSSCDKDNGSNNNTNTESGYNLGGGYWSGWYDDHHLITFQFDREWLGGSNYANTPGKLIYQELYDQDWGISAHGSYSVNRDVINANFSNVTVRMEDYSYGSYHGYINGVSTTKHFTIKSCTPDKLVINDELGRTISMNHYNFAH